MTQTYLPGDIRMRIQDLMKEKKVTQAELAEIIGTSESTLSRFLKGKTEMLGDGYIIRIARYFKVSTDFLLGETDIPDRKNYDIEELGLTGEAAKALYTGKVNTEMVSKLLEHPKFAQLTYILSRYQDESLTAGIAAQNQNLNFISNMLLGQAKSHPEDTASCIQLSQAVRSFRTPAITADTNMIQNLFMQIVRDLKEASPSGLQSSQTMNKEILDRFRNELSKGEAAPDLRSVTPEDMSGAILRMIDGSGIPQSVQNDLGNALTELFTAAGGSAHDK